MHYGGRVDILADGDISLLQTVSIAALLFITAVVFAIILDHLRR